MTLNCNNLISGNLIICIPLKSIFLAKWKKTSEDSMWISIVDNSLFIKLKLISPLIDPVRLKLLLFTNSFIIESLRLKSWNFKLIISLPLDLNDLKVKSF